ncbi:DUF1501 domain-containing protein [bacterium]|nr:DUF1501 domain-containing protein [bacterium]MBP9807700.1 DUF1501 domain-containing protein [bacterium]
MASPKDYSRRAFLRKLAFADEAHLGAINKSLVCIFLRGGADTLNMLVPYANDDYYKLRPNIAIKSPSRGGSAAAIKLDDHYGFHPNMAPLLPIYKEGRLGMVQAVGTDNFTGSHFEAQDQVDHGESCGHSLGGGWLGRHLATRSLEQQTPLSAVAIGTALPESLRGAPSASVLNSIEEIKLQAPAGQSQAIAKALAKLYGAEVALLAEPSKITLDLLGRVEKLQGKSYRPANGADYPDNTFGKGLREIARLLKGGVGLEVAALDLNGWDTHFFQGAEAGLQADSIEQLANGLAAFDKDLASCRSAVTTLVITEFGRRSYENSSMGTDHGRGFTVFAIGDRIAGGQVHGPLPHLTRGEQMDLLGPSGLAVQFDYRSALSEILVRALDNRRIESVFPAFKGQEIGLVKRAIV